MNVSFTHHMNLASLEYEVHESGKPVGFSHHCRPRQRLRQEVRLGCILGANEPFARKVAFGASPLPWRDPARCYVCVSSPREPMDQGWGANNEGKRGTQVWYTPAASGFGRGPLPGLPGQPKVRSKCNNGAIKTALSLCSSLRKAVVKAGF